MAGREISGKAGTILDSGSDAVIENGSSESHLLLLQGRPIGEPVANGGPFVMNTRAEIEQAFADNRRTQFGGWPWPVGDPVHGAARGRFARYADGREEEPGPTGAPLLSP